MLGPAGPAALAADAVAPSAQSRWLIAPAMLAVGAALFTTVVTVAAAARFDTALPHADQWDFLPMVGSYFQGTLSFADLAAQHNEHRILFPRLFMLADQVWFGGRNSSLLVVAIAVQALHCLLLVHVLRRGRQVGVAAATIFAALTCTCLFHAAQIVNFFDGFQVQFLMVYAAATAAFVALVRRNAARTAASRMLWLLTCLAMAAVATWSMGNGVLVWPLLVTLAFQTRASWRTIAAMAACGAIALAGFFHGYRAANASGGLGQAMHDPLAWSARVFGFLGSFLRDQGVGVAIGAGIVLAVFTATTVLATGSMRRSAAPMHAVWLHLLLLLVGSALAGASGRMHLPLVDVVSSRYATPALMIVVATFALLFASARARVRTWTATAAAVATLALAGTVRSNVAMFEAVPAMQNDAASCLLAGVADEPALAGSKPMPPAVMFRLAAILREQRLSIYSGGLDYLLGSPVLAHFTPDSTGALTDSSYTVEPVAGQPGAFRLEGSLTPREPRALTGQILVLDRHGSVVGFGCTDVRFARAATVPWRAWARTDADGAAGLIGAAVVAGNRVARMEMSIGAESLDDAETETTAIDGVHVETTGAFEIDGQHPSAPKPSSPQTTWGSWSGSDRNQGTIRFTLTALDRECVLTVPLLTGPGNAGLSVRVVDPRTDAVVAELRRPPPFPTRWRRWNARLPARADGGAWLVEARDDGAGWGQWLAVGSPRWLHR